MIVFYLIYLLQVLFSADLKKFKGENSPKKSKVNTQKLMVHECYPVKTRSKYTYLSWSTVILRVLAGFLPLTFHCTHHKDRIKDVTQEVTPLPMFMTCGALFHIPDLLHFFMVFFGQNLGSFLVNDTVALHQLCQT